jgi:hypothetical protein
MQDLIHANSLAFHIISTVSQGKDIFGDGNIEGAVSEFEKQHSCSYYCEWLGFGLHAFKRQQDSDGGDDIEHTATGSNRDGTD